MSVELSNCHDIYMNIIIIYSETSLNQPTTGSPSYGPIREGVGLGSLNIGSVVLDGTHIK